MTHFEDTDVLGLAWRYGIDGRKNLENLRRLMQHSYSNGVADTAIRAQYEIKDDRDIMEYLLKLQVKTEAIWKKPETDWFVPDSGPVIRPPETPAWRRAITWFFGV